MQNTFVKLSTAVLQMNNVTNHVTDYGSNGYESVLGSAKQLATELDVEIIFKSKRLCRNKKLFEYESTDEVSNACEPEKYFKNHVFYEMLDRAINSLPERFEQLKRFNDIWKFLKDLNDLPEKNELKVRACQDVEN